MDKTYFYPNCCHVCKRWDTQLKTCNKCRMISYCGREHQLEHWPQHKQICAAIKGVLEDKKYMNTEEISITEWENICSHYSTRVKGVLQRDMKTEEKQMFLFTNACRVCHRQDALIRCNECPSAAFCSKHRDQSEHRKKYCKLMRRSLEIHKCLYTTELDFSYAYLPCETPFHNMKSFLDAYVPSNNIHFQALHSDMFTNPLTAYFCMKKLDHLTCKMLCFHVIESHEIELAACDIWYIIPMLIPTLTMLTITFIKLKFIKSKSNKKCKETTRFITLPNDKTVQLIEHYMSYEEYMESPNFNTPNFIIGFNSFVIDESYEQENFVDISKGLGRAPNKLKCPFILIFDDLQQTDKDRLCKIKKCLFLKNPFQNLRPYRNRTDRVFCCNSHLAIFDNLQPNKVFTNNENKCFLLLKTIQE